MVETHIPLDASVSPLRRRYRHPVFLGVAYALWIALLCYGGLKLFWWWQFRVPVSQSPGTETVWCTFYPELYHSGVLDTKLSADDGYYDVLLLGASVLEQTAPSLKQNLQKELGGRLRLFSLARAAHTSRDSFIKHSRLADRHFDLVIFYHAINDCRVNCCPDEMFRADYSHMGWYRGFQERLASGGMSVADILSRSLARSKDLVPEDNQWQSYGEHVKTGESFRSNLEPIVQAAERRHSPIVLMTFAIYVAPRYTEEAFLAKRLGYGSGVPIDPISVWGTPKGVKSAIDVHNSVIRDIASRHQNVIFIDQSKTMPADGEHFCDVCHLTRAGIDLFVRHVMDAVRPDVDRWKAAHPATSPQSDAAAPTKSSGGTSRGT